MTRRMHLAVPDTHDPEWELRETCSSWEDADRYRTAIVNNSQRSARVRYVHPNYLVEWKP